MKIDMCKKQQKEEPSYRKTLSKGQFPICIISISTLRNTNIVFPCNGMAKKWINGNVKNVHIFKWSIFFSVSIAK